MAKVEIDESELGVMQKAMGLLTKLNNSQKARKHLERAVKEEFPDVVTDEERTAEIAAPYVEKIKKLEETIESRFSALDAEKKKAADDAADFDLWQRFTALQTKNGYTDDGMQKIAEIMKQRSIADPEAAAALFDRLNPRPPEPAPNNWEPQRWNFTEDADKSVDVKALYGNPDAWADKEVGKILADVRSSAAA